MATGAIIATAVLVYLAFHPGRAHANVRPTLGVITVGHPTPTGLVSSPALDAPQVHKG